MRLSGVSAVRRPEVSDVEEAVLEVVAEQGIGTLYRVRDGDGAVRMVEVHRTNVPWGRPPPKGAEWTSDEELRQILDHLDPD